ncbi:MAG: hypothetical protein IJL20_10645 [Lachnospiraceae bacterium]|nr:hypothetical protein [Lachnospiraceae bacterium]
MNQLIHNLQDFTFFKNRVQRDGISNENFPQEFFPLVALYTRDCCYNLTQCYTDYHRLFIYGRYREENCELMLRINPESPVGLVIARVRFINQRKGNLTKLIELLEEIRQINSLGEIIIESVTSPEMRNWVNKHGWVEIKELPSCFLSPEGMERYQYAVDITRKKFQSKRKH